MSRQEILSWTSLFISFSVIFFYVMFVFGWPEAIPDLSDRFTKIFVNVLWIALAIELLIGITEHKARVIKDERDEQIEASGHKIAYSFLTGSIILVLFQIFLSNLFGKPGSDYLLLGNPNMIFHVLFIVLFASGIIKRVTMIYYYRKKW